MRLETISRTDVAFSGLPPGRNVVEILKAISDSMPG